jgi:toxin ParE1/3/4
MRRAVFLASVRHDLLVILTSIAEISGSVAVAQAFVRELCAKCHRLASLDATVGRARPELRGDIRSFPYKNHVIFFRSVFSMTTRSRVDRASPHPHAFSSVKRANFLA